MYREEIGSELENNDKKENLFMWVKFTNNKNRIPEGIKILCEIDNLYLYGNGAYAEQIYTKLSRWSITLQGVIVSDEYYKEITYDYKFHGLKVLSFSEVKATRINLIAGYHILMHEDLNKFLVDSKNVEKIYYFEGLSIFDSNLQLRKDITLLDDYFRILLNRNLDYPYFQENYDKFSQTYSWLNDEKSKETMKCYLQGHIEVRSWPMLSVWDKDDVEMQYFPKDIIKLSQHEVFVDVGAFTGDTLEIFSNQVDAFDKYYALEPDITRFKELKRIIEKVYKKGNVIHLPVGASDKKGKAVFSQLSTGCGAVIDNDICGNGGERIEVDSIDNLLGLDERVSFIKMDIEGAEMLALYGAKNTIQRCKPKLAICVYHKREDLITIPQYLKQLVPNYKLFLIAHRPFAGEIVLYCV